MPEIDLVCAPQGVKRDYDARAKEKTDSVIATAKKFGKDFFDGDRLYGYGGYRYDGRSLSFAKKLVAHYNLQ